MHARHFFNALEERVRELEDQLAQAAALFDESEGKQAHLSGFPSDEATKAVMDNLKMLTLNLDRDYDAWQDADSDDLAGMVATAAGLGRGNVKIVDLQRGSVIASTVLFAPDWAAVCAQLEAALMDDGGPLKSKGVVGCVGLASGALGLPPGTRAPHPAEAGSPSKPLAAEDAEAREAVHASAIAELKAELKRAEDAKAALEEEISTLRLPAASEVSASPQVPAGNSESEYAAMIAQLRSELVLAVQANCQLEEELGALAKRVELKGADGAADVAAAPSGDSEDVGELKAKSAALAVTLDEATAAIDRGEDADASVARGELEASLERARGLLGESEAAVAERDAELSRLRQVNAELEAALERSNPEDTNSAVAAGETEGSVSGSAQLRVQELERDLAASQSELEAAKEQLGKETEASAGNTDSEQLKAQVAELTADRERLQAACDAALLQFEQAKAANAELQVLMTSERETSTASASQIAEGSGGVTDPEGGNDEVEALKAKVAELSRSLKTAEEIFRARDDPSALSQTAGGEYCYP